MEVLKPVMDKMDDTVGGLVNNFDLGNENIGGMFTNMTMLTMLLSTLTDRPFPKTKETFDPEYDYVIVGGGTAGCVMANRLSEIPCVTVLLLEAGGLAPLLSDIPGYARVFHGSNIDWAYKTEPQKDCAYGHIDNSITLNGGKVLGGGSVINAMLYVRGSKEDFDHWKREGCTDWGYEDVKPYFLKLEDNKNIDELDKGYHQTGGPVQFMKPCYRAEVKGPLLEALDDLGYKGTTDINGRRMTGIYDLQANMRDGRRCSTAKAYLVPAEDRPNLTIMKRTFVTKIIFEGKRAIGVEFDYKGSSQTVRASREVIVSSGTFRAPQLLMLSGIGPKEHLDEMKIPVIADSPVGKNLQDHYSAPLYFEVDPLIVMNAALKLIYPPNILEYITNRSGILGSASEVSFMAFLGLDKVNSTSNDYPRHELYFTEYSAADAVRSFNLKAKAIEEGYAKYLLSSAFACISSLTHPASRGEVTLKSLDPHDDPRIDPRYYSEEKDLWDIVDGMKACEAICTHKALDPLKAKPFDVNYSWCKQFEGNKTATYACMAKTVIETFWHYVGTCKMGHRKDPTTVVDPQGRVKGVCGLRVVCAAIMPYVTTGNTNVPTMMIAEKISDKMKKCIKCDGSNAVKPGKKKDGGKCKCKKCEKKEKEKSKCKSKNN